MMGLSKNNLLQGLFINYVSKEVRERVCLDVLLGPRNVTKGREAVKYHPSW